MNDFPNRIRQLREEISMTQIRLSTELEVSQETISAYETGRHYPSFHSLLRMSQIFHASIDYIMGLSEQRRPQTFRAQDERQQQLLELFSALDELGQAQALGYLQGLYDGKNSKTAQTKAAQTKKPFPRP